MLSNILNIFKPSPPKIKFLKDDLIILDELQNQIIGTQDGSQSVEYKSDEQIFELCLELNKKLFGDCMTNYTSVSPSIAFGQFNNIDRILGAYFTQNLNKTL